MFKIPKPERVLPDDFQKEIDEKVRVFMYSEMNRNPLVNPCFKQYVINNYRENLEIAAWIKIENMISGEIILTEKTISGGCTI